MTDTQPEEEYRWDGGRIQCPACEHEGYTDARINLCRCSRWLRVYDNEGADVRVVEGPWDGIDD